MHHLERYYSGNENWIVFSKLYEAYKDIEKVQGLARKFNDDLILASVIGNDSNLLIVFYVQIMPDDFVMQLHRF